jgi:hypothetical protein
MVVRKFKFEMYRGKLYKEVVSTIQSESYSYLRPRFIPVLHSLMWTRVFKVIQGV